MQNRSSSIDHLVQEVIRLQLENEKTHNLMNSFNLLIDSFPYSGDTLANYAFKRQLLPHLEEFLPQLEACEQEYQLRKDREKRISMPFTKLRSPWL
jgi:hypothetical protein